MSHDYKFSQILPYNDFRELKPVIQWCKSAIGEHNQGWCVVITDQSVEWWFEKREHWAEFTLRWL